MITVDGLTKTYGSRQAVDDLSFAVTGGPFQPQHPLVEQSIGQVVANEVIG